MAELVGLLKELVDKVRELQLEGEGLESLTAEDIESLLIGHVTVEYGINLHTCSVTHQSLGHRITGKVTSLIEFTYMLIN